MGYKKGDWEFCASTTKILRDVHDMTDGKGILALDCSHWMVSDDTVEHLATAEGLIKGLSGNKSATRISPDLLMPSVAKHSKAATADFTARAPGKSEQKGLKLLDADGKNWTAKPFDSLAVGCGAAMRTACIGLVFRSDMPSLVGMAVETSRLTKTHPTGYLGGVCAAVFVAFALQGLPVELWGPRFLDDILPLVKAHINQAGRHLSENAAAFSAGDFEAKWEWYLQQRGLRSNLAFPSVYGPSERDSFYAACACMPGVNPSGKNPGSKGYDSVLIAYDALLWVETNCASGPERWEELCYRAVLHRGDNDSTGSIAAAWYGAMHGFEGVPACHQGVEYRGRCDSAGLLLDKLARNLETATS
eukprot:TRINITY_DN76190_c0_g1_i1.p1 TRINITY_DN76190_c0_g1~~TRINITY_DN76190_c0_g1_i1.p1  ORF type:complete len:400 (-),score=61.29 TRINITY_DN76190_c0_g1_i1:103-1185(-)